MESRTSLRAYAFDESRHDRPASGCRPDGRLIRTAVGIRPRRANSPGMSGADLPVRSPAAGTVDFGPLSPELALVDPELRRAARALLPDFPPGGAAPRPVAAAQADLVGRLSESLEPPREQNSRRRLPLVLVATTSGALAVAVIVTLLVRAERLPTAPQQTAPEGAVGVTPELEPVRTAPARTAPTGDRTSDYPSSCASCTSAGCRGTSVRLGPRPRIVGVRVPALPRSGASVPGTRDRAAARAPGTLAAGRSTARRSSRGPTGGTSGRSRAGRSGRPPWRSCRRVS